MNKLALLLALIIFCQPVHAEIISVAPQYEQRYHSLLEQLRCLVCQNQTLADSGSGLATDLRVQVKQMLEQGSTDQEILDFMSARYGDFVLYMPPVKTHTLFLWIGPFVLLLIGVVAALLLVRQRGQREYSISDSDQQRLQKLLAEQSSENK